MQSLLSSQIPTQFYKLYDHGMKQHNWFNLYCTDNEIWGMKAKEFQFNSLFIDVCAQ